MKQKQYDVAAYIWPAYTGDEPRTRIFWPKATANGKPIKSIDHALLLLAEFHRIGD